jgi:hypothetical protein
MTQEKFNQDKEGPLDLIEKIQVVILESLHHQQKLNRLR